MFRKYLILLCFFIFPTSLYAVVEEVIFENSLYRVVTVNERCSQIFIWDKRTDKRVKRKIIDTIKVVYDFSNPICVERGSSNQLLTVAQSTNDDLDDNRYLTIYYDEEGILDDGVEKKLLQFGRCIIVDLQSGKSISDERVRDPVCF